ncbi:MAG: hypothetical protein ACO3MZ_02440 [Flavobacteriaceae bacterium]
MKNIRFLLLLMTMNYAVAQNHHIPLALDSTNTEVFNRGPLMRGSSIWT